MRPSTLFSLIPAIALIPSAVCQGGFVHEADKGTVEIYNATNLPPNGEKDKLGCIDIHGRGTDETTKCGEFASDHDGRIFHGEKDLAMDLQVTSELAVIHLDKLRWEWTTYGDQEDEIPSWALQLQHAGATGGFIRDMGPVFESVPGDGSAEGGYNVSITRAALKHDPKNPVVLRYVPS